MHARTSVQLAILPMLHADLFQQVLLTDLPHRRLALLPQIKSAARDLQHTADRTHRPAGAMFVDEAELHGCSLAKNAAAFFKISRSINSRAFSLRNRRSSALSAPSPLGITPS